MRDNAKKILPALFAAAAAILLNGLLFWYVNCTGEYLQTSDIYGRQYSERRSDSRRVTDIISSPEGNITALENRISYFSEVIGAANTMKNELSRGRDEAEKLTAEFTLRYGVSGYTEISDRAKAEMDTCTAALAKLSYAENYGEYADSIADSAGQLSDISLFSGNQWIRSNIIKTQKDFYGLDKISVIPTADNALSSLLNYHVTDFLALLTAFVSIPFFFVFSSNIKSSLSADRKLLILPVTVAVLNSAVMYLTDFAMTFALIGSIRPDIPVQSYEPFLSCPYAVSTGIVMLVCFAAKLLGVLTFSLIILLIMSREKRRVRTSVITGAFVLFEFVAHITGIFGTLLQEINIFSLFTFERFFCRYLNLDIFGAAVSRLPVFAVFAGIIVTLVFVLAPLSVSKYVRTARENAERGYYDEVNRRYVESRKIRHDINNHLLAISYLIESGNISAAQKYISEVSEKTDLAAQPLKTGSDVLDALLYKKSVQAQELGITLENEVSAPVPESISDYDLCTVFGNILDNAFEAAPQGSVVKLTIGQQHEMLYIACENSFTGKLTRENGRIVTAKADKNSHGYGLLRVSEVAEKYSGTVKISDENGIFRIEILIIK